MPDSGATPPPPSEGPVWLNQWAAEDLDARVGDTVQLEYFVWTDEGGLETRRTTPDDAGRAADDARSAAIAR